MTTVITLFEHTLAYTRLEQIIGIENSLLASSYGCTFNMEEVYKEGGSHVKTFNHHIVAHQLKRHVEPVLASVSEKYSFRLYRKLLLQEQPFS